MGDKLPGTHRPKRKRQAPPKVRGVAIGQVIAVRQLKSIGKRGATLTIEIGKPWKSRGRN